MKVTARHIGDDERLTQYGVIWTGRFRLPEPAAVERDVALALPA